MKFLLKTDHLCKGCGRLRSKGYHEPCSKKVQALGGFRTTTAPKVRSPREIEQFVKRLIKL